jgi:hypothetical protein
MFIEQSSAAQTQYANLAQAARQQNLQRTLADLPGGVVHKTIKNRLYWYYQYKEPTGTPKQIYLGPDDDDTRLLVADHQNPHAAQTRQHLKNLCEAAMALGCYHVIAKHARVLDRLAHHGLFHAGAVLVGTHAYLAYQNRWGIRWTSGDTTVDLDFAHPGRNLSIALNNDLQIDGHAAINTLKMGFLPVNEGTRYVKPDEPDFDLDFLTCLHRGGQAPIAMPQLNLSLQPLRFMEYAMESPVTTVLLASSGPIVVNIPRPERYAMAKLLIHPERLAGQHPEKAPKDLLQAASLIHYLQQHDPEALQEAWDDLVSRGRTWRQNARKGLNALKLRHPNVDCTFEPC